MKSPTLMLVLALVALVAGCAALTPAPPPEQNAELRLERGLTALNAGQYSAAFDDLVWVYSHCPGREAGSRALVALAALDLDPRNRAARPDVGVELLGRAIREPGTPHWLIPMAETAFLTALALGAPHPGGDAHRDHDDDLPVDSAAQADAAAQADSVSRGGAIEASQADSVPASQADSISGARADSLASSASLAGVPAPDAEGERKGDPGVEARAVPAPVQATSERVSGCGAALPTVDSVARPLPALPGPSMAMLLARSEARRDSVAGRADTLQSQLTVVRQQLQAARAELERIRKTLKP